MIKIFISHSSQQKDFINRVVDEVGRDMCYVDAYDFTPCYRTIDEIVDKIGKSIVFVFFVTKHSLESEWCKKEVRIAAERYKSGELKLFLPYIIDPEVSTDGIPAWMYSEQAFTLRYFPSQLSVARDIKQKCRELIRCTNPVAYRMDTAYVGRNEELAMFENKYLSAELNRRRACIVSGRMNVGRKRFARKCMEYLTNNENCWYPYEISLDSKSYVEDYIIQTNDIVRAYFDEQLDSVLHDTQERKIDMAVDLTNRLYDIQGYLFIKDHMGCVRPDGNMAEWFEKMITHPDLKRTLRIFLISTMTPRTSIESTYKQIIHVRLKPLTYGERLSLLYKYATIVGVSISEDDAGFFASKLLSSPSQFRDIVQAIAGSNVKQVKKDIDVFVNNGERPMRATFDKITKDELMRDLVLVLSKVEMISYGQLEKIFGNGYPEVDKRISDLIRQNLIDELGDASNYVKLDPLLSDMINRSKRKLPDDLFRLMEETLNDDMADFVNENTELSSYLYSQKNKFMNSGLPLDRILPSVVVRGVIELYNNEDWNTVIKICDEALSKDSRTYSAEVRDELQIWLCSALAHKGDERFWDEVRKIVNRAENSFLKGFFTRLNGDISRALDFFDEALDYNPSNNRAKREKVIILLKMRKYHDALSLAKENYENQSDNTYHIQAYFRCLVKKPGLDSADRALLRQLIVEMRDSVTSDRRKDGIVRSMEIEYTAYIDRKPVVEVLSMLDTAIRDFPNSRELKRVRNEIRVKQGIEKTDYTLD